MISKITLGTAQLGMNYGVSNRVGKPTSQEAIQILKFATSHGINSFDTSPSYGNSEKIIGTFFEKIGRNNSVNIITKIPKIQFSQKSPSFDDVYSKVKKSICASSKRLKINKIPTCLLHNPSDIHNYDGFILRAKDFLPQLRQKLENFESGVKLRQIQIKSSNLKFGITLMAFGFLKKMFFADNIAPMVNDVFTTPIGAESFTIIIGALAFGIQIYCDFSGYSDIAIGAAMILGFKIPLNFNKPYFAISPSDFWRRWHISLSSWLRDYLYIPLGGNKKSSGRTFFNLFIVMFLGGLWHGASWNFVVWGLLHGLYLAIHKALKNAFPNLAIHPFFKSKIGKIISIFVTQYFVFLAWIPFRVRDVDSMFYSMSKYVLLDFEIAGTLEFIFSHKVPFLLMIIFIALNYFSYKHTNLWQSIANLKIRYWFIFILVTILAILFMYDGDPEMFIYFQF